LLPAGLMLIDDSGTILDANPTYCKNIGYKAEEIIGEKIWKVVNNPLAGEERTHSELYPNHSQEQSRRKRGGEFPQKRRASLSSSLRNPHYS